MKPTETENGKIMNITMNTPLLRKVYFFTTLIVGLAGDANAQSEAPTADERLVLLRTDRDRSEAIARDDMERVFSFWMDDAVVYPAYRAPARGKPAIRRFFHTNRARPGFSLTTEPFEARVAQAGDLGYTVGQYEFQFEAADGSPLTLAGVYLTLWRNVEGEGWKCFLEIQSPLGDVPADFDGGEAGDPSGDQRSRGDSTDLKPDGDMSPERAALLETRREWSEAIAAGDLERIFPFWTDDAVIYAAHRPSVRGKVAIREFVRGNRAQPGFSLTSDTFALEISRSGDLAYTVGNYEFTWDGPDGTPVRRRGRFVCGWRKNEDGAWKCMLEIHSPLRPPR